MAIKAALSFHLQGQLLRICVAMDVAPVTKRPHLSLCSDDLKSLLLSTLQQVEPNASWNCLCNLPAAA
jgi:hypothetical protein